LPEFAQRELVDSIKCESLESGFLFGSDTYPNKWFEKYAKNADLVIHEFFVSVPSLIEKFKFTPQTALLVGTAVFKGNSGSNGTVKRNRWRATDFLE